MNLSVLSESVELSESLRAFCEIVGPRSVCESSVSLRHQSACGPSMYLSVEPSVSLRASSESAGPLNLWTLAILWALSESVGLQ